MIFKLYVIATITVFLVFETSCCLRVNEIQTEPVLINNTLARHFNKLKLLITVLFVNESYFWTHPDFIPVKQTAIYTAVGSCQNSVENGFNVTCQQISLGNSTFIMSSLTLMFPLDRGVTFAVIRTGTNEVQLAFIDIKVKDCSISPRRSLEVISQSSDYNAVGEFRCPNNEILYYSNTTRVVSNKTKCLATAQWKDSNIAQCWRASTNVSVAGNLNVVNGDNINLTCKHQPGVPASNGSLFFFNGSSIYVKKGKNFTITNVQKTNHNQPVSCQVQSPYVELVDQSSGRSQQRFINVLFRPYTASPQYCMWEVHVTGICNISFQSNPKAQFRSILFKGTDISHFNDASNLAQSSLFEQYYTFIRREVNKTFIGFYTLVLFSSGFDETNLSFYINVVDRSETTQSTSSSSSLSTITTVAVVVTAVVVASSALLFVICLKKTNKVASNGATQLVVPLPGSSPPSDHNRSNQKYVTAIEHIQQDCENLRHSVEVKEDESGYIVTTHSEFNVQKSSTETERIYENLKNNTEVKKEKNGDLALNPFVLNMQEEPANPLATYEVIGAGQKPAALPTATYETIGVVNPNFEDNNYYGYVNAMQQPNLP